jgi:hypothetical protein
LITGFIERLEHVTTNHYNFLTNLHTLLVMIMELEE